MTVEQYRADYAAKFGLPSGVRFDHSESIIQRYYSEVMRQHPELSFLEAEGRALARLDAKEYQRQQSKALLAPVVPIAEAKPEPAVVHPISYRRELWAIIALLVLLLLTGRANAQLDGLRISASGTTQKQWSGGLAKIDFGSGLVVDCSTTPGTCKVTATGVAPGSGITTLNGLSADPQTFARTNDTNVTLTINSVTSTHTFVLGWTGTLGKSRGGAGADMSSVTFPSSGTIQTAQTTLAGYGITDAVPATRTVNGHALSSNVSVTASDVGNGTAQWNANQINGVALSGLSTGILKNTTTTGVPSIAIAADFPTLNQNTTGTAAGLTAAYIDWNAVSGGAFIQNKPSTFTPSAHNLLSSSHGDTTAASAVRGDMLAAVGASPTWQRVAHSATTGGGWKWNGTDVVSTTTAIAGAGAATACTNQVVTNVTTNADAVPTLTCSTVTSSMTSGTFSPSSHVLNSATHTVSGLTTGNFLRANSATTFDFSAIQAGDLPTGFVDAVGDINNSLCTANQILKKNAGNTAWACAADDTGTGGGGTIASTSSVLKGDGAGNAVAATSGTDYVIPSGSVATLTTPRAIYGNNFDGSAALTAIIASTYGGTGNGFTKFSGPATAEKTFTLPNASATILTDNALVTAAQGGTGNGFFAVSGPATATKTFTFPNASATVLTTNAAVTVAQGGTGVGTLTGIIKGNGTSAFSAAVAADVVGLFNSGTCSGYLKSDGTCSTPSVGTASSLTSATANPASTGVVKLANNTDKVCWRNAANSADLCFYLDSNNAWVFDGTGGTDTVVEAAAPASPATGYGVTWIDSTDHRFHDKNPAGTIGTTVVADTGAANNFLTAVSAAGVISKAQPSAANLSNGTTGTAGTAVVLATSPTIVTPTIASFTNATHNHTNAAGGGQITDAALSSAVTIAKGGTGTGSTLTGLVRGSASAMTAAELSGDVTTSGSNAVTLATKYKTWVCETGIGDGLNAVTAGTYLQSFCWNKTGASVTLTAVQCYTDNAGSSTLNAAGNTLGALLTGAVTCSSTIASGTQSANVVLTNNDYIKFTWVADGTSKQTTWVVTGTY